MATPHESVRPSDRAVPATADEVDPLAGWDTATPDTVDGMHLAQPWAVIAGAAGFGALLGSTADRRGRGVRRGAVLGALVAAVALRVWEREPEPDEWARTLQ